MPSEILIYGSIDSYSATDFINQVSLVDESDELTVRINSGGGSPEYGWGMIAKFSEFTGKKNVKVDGQAYSMAAFYTCYADDVECLDVTEFLFHRAAYPQWMEQSDSFDDSMRGNLDRVNASLRKALEAKVDPKLFQEITGVSIKSLFSIDDRIDVFIQAKDAKKLGLVNKIIPMTPSKRSEIEANISKAAKFNGLSPKETKKENENKKSEIMTIEKLNQEHPELVAKIKDAAVKTERDRVGAHLVFIDVDAAAVKQGIESGESLSQAKMAEFTLKMVSKQEIKKVEGDNPSAVLTDEQKASAKTEKEQKIAAFEAELDSKLNLKK